MKMSKNHTLLSLAFGLEDGEELDLVDGAELDLPEDQDLENREMISEIAATEDYYSHYNPYANAIHNATQLFLTSHKSFESFVSALGNEDFMQPFKGSNSYDMIVASAIDNVGNMMRYYPISVEDYSLNDLVANIAVEEYAISFEGAAGAATTGIIARLANLGSAGWSRIKSWGEAIAAGYKALKNAIFKKDWGAVRAIKGFITRAKRYAKDPKKMFPRLIPGNKAKKIADVNRTRSVLNDGRRLEKAAEEARKARNAKQAAEEARKAMVKRVRNNVRDSRSIRKSKDFQEFDKSTRRKLNNAALDSGSIMAELDIPRYGNIPGDTRSLYRRLSKRLMKKDKLTEDLASKKATQMAERQARLGNVDGVKITDSYHYGKGK